jgi:hypothetical protein
VSHLILFLLTIKPIVENIDSKLSLHDNDNKPIIEDMEEYK